MNLRHILTIVRKDLLDAIRDARVLVAVVMPLGVGLLYNVMFTDEPPRPTATVAYAADADTALPDALRAVVGGSVDLTVTRAADEAAVRHLVAAKRADLGLVAPPGFDAAVAGGQAPPLVVIRRAGTPGVGAGYVAAGLDPALRRLAGQGPPATMHRETIAAELVGTQAIIDQVGLRRYFVAVADFLLIGMIGLIALPIILAEETEKRTLDALTLIASYGEVIAAKALVGLAYIAASTALLFAITRLRPAAPALFLGALALSSVLMVGGGLLLGGLFRSANQVNTWGGVILLPLLAPAFLVGMPLPAGVQTALLALPTGQAMRLALNGISGRPLFPHAWLSFLVVAAWAGLAYAALLWRLSRREA